MPKVLFVCQANVCRSQFAEAYYNRFTRSKDGFSAGVEDFTDDYPTLPDMMLKLAFEDKLDLSGQKPKFLTPEMVDISNRVYVLCRRDECPGYLLNCGKVEFWNIPDPFRTSLDYTRYVRNLIKYHVEQIVPK